jgi:hypothetical protein
VLGALLRSCSPAEIVAAVSAGSDPRAALPAAGRGIPGLARAFERWRARLGQIPPPAGRAAWERDGMRLLCPGEPEWPTRLDDLGDARPVMLWVRGRTDLRFACLQSVSVASPSRRTSCRARAGFAVMRGALDGSGRRGGPGRSWCSRAMPSRVGVISLEGRSVAHPQISGGAPQISRGCARLIDPLGPIPACSSAERWHSTVMKRGKGSSWLAVAQGRTAWALTGRRAVVPDEKTAGSSLRPISPAARRYVRNRQAYRSCPE